MSTHVRRGPSTRPREIRWWPLTTVTAADYLWQIPYAVHQYGRHWLDLAGLSIPLVLTGVWFAAALTGTVRGWRGARPALAAFLATEVAFYLMHNLTGAFLADLPLGNPVLLIASLLGYASTVVAVVYLVLMARARRARRNT